MMSADATVAGLDPAEARRRLVTFGPNRLVARERAARLKDALRSFLDPMTLMLLAAAGLYFAAGDARDAYVMLIALVPVLGVDVFLEARSRAALARLAERIAPRARVVRGGRETDVPTHELVPGDVLLLAEGDVVHADGIVRRAANLAIDEASLTGESEPRDKGPSAPVYAGSRVLSGHGACEVTATGLATRYGEIARLVAAAESAQTPLQRRTMRLVRQLAVVAVGVAVLVALLIRWRGEAWSGALLGGLSLALSAMPEEFPLVLTLFLSAGAWRLARHGVLVRRIASVETLGVTTVICTDKTGTLTEGVFRVDAVVPLAGVDRARLLAAAVLACEVDPADSMERSLVAHAADDGVAASDLRRDWRLVADYDFDPIGKHMSHVWQRASDGAAPRIVAKGALEGVLQHCAISPERRAAAEAAHAELARRAMRVLAVAERTSGGLGASRVDDERDLELIGLVGFRDPLRAGVAEAVAECQAAGVRVKLVTGDHALTAHAIADLAGIAHTPDGIVTGPELEALDRGARAKRIATAGVLARISPPQKHEIVEVLEGRGEIVAMTGDGINDAPALRRAHIGVSMGARATEVARASADMVLLDDDFAALVAAVHEGRRISRDLRRAFLYLVAFHVPIVALALVPPLVGAPLLLMPVHLVWLELVVHPISAFAFQGPLTPGLMRQPPRAASAPLLDGRSVARSAATGALLAAAVLSDYLLALPSGTVAARSGALVALLVGVQLLVLGERRGARGSDEPFLPTSPSFWLLWALPLATLPVALYSAPLASVLHVRPPSAGQWALALVAACLGAGWRLVIPQDRRAT